MRQDQMSEQEGVTECHWGPFLSLSLSDTHTNTHTCIDASDPFFLLLMDFQNTPAGSRWIPGAPWYARIRPTYPSVEHKDFRPNAHIETCAHLADALTQSWPCYVNSLSINKRGSKLRNELRCHRVQWSSAGWAFLRLPDAAAHKKHGGVKCFIKSQNTPQSSGWGRKVSVAMKAKCDTVQQKHQLKHQVKLQIHWRQKAGKTVTWWGDCFFSC